MKTGMKWAVAVTDMPSKYKDILVVDENNTLIADCYPDSELDFGLPDLEDVAKNAKLIAAAPELLAALEALFEHCAMIHNKWGEGCNQRESDAAMLVGRAAIAKAKGEQS